MELRWLEIETGRQLMNEWGYYYQETQRVLQWKIDENSEWMTVPTVIENRSH